MLKSTARGVLRIGALRVDPGLDEIDIEGRIIKLEPKAMRLLMCLAEHAGEVVSVEQLLAAVWKDVIVTPESVYQAVAGLRRVLGDDSKNPTYIANVVRRGYRLIAPVAPWTESGAPSAEPAIAPVSVQDHGALAPAAPTPAELPAKDPPVAQNPGSAAPLRMALIALLGVALLAGIMFAVRHYRQSSHERAVSPAASVVVQDSSVAVLPFRDLSEKQDEEYFADGLVEEIIDLLADVPGLRVPARTSSFYFKGKSTNAQEIARVLGVAHILEGSVRRSAGNVRITTTLSRADNGYQIWSQTYELGEIDLLAIQHDIATAVVRNLTAVMLPSAPHAPLSPAEATAHIAVLRARFLLNRGSDKDNREAIAVLQSAVELAPGSAVAWAELARAHRHRASYFDELPDGDIALARTQALKALSLDPTCAEAHNVLADIKRTYDFDPDGGLREIQAIRAADPAKPVPNGDLFYIYSGCVLGPCYEQIIRDTDEEIANDPLNPIPYWTQALARYVFGDLAGAERQIRHAIALSPGNGYQYYLLARILFARHDWTRLLETAKTSPDSLYNRASMVLALDALGRGSEADAALRDFVTHNSKDGAYQLAEVYAARGQLQDAMTWLERAYLQHDPGLWTLKVDPLLRPLAGDARFGALQSKLHMR